MSYDDWNPDDFLDFDYGNKGSQKKSKDTVKKKSNAEYREYLASRDANSNNVRNEVSGKDEVSVAGRIFGAGKSSKEAKAGKSTKVKKQKPARKRSEHSAAEIAALQQAQQQADKRYRSTYEKNVQKTKGRRPAYRSGIWIARLYLITFVVFVVTMAIMDVLPLTWLIVLIAVLLLLSVLLLPRMRRGGKKRSTKPLATLACLILMALYVTGTAYALGTLSFLSSTSVDNENRVGKITRDPFNVVITGMDVEGKIAEEGRSDVNMVLTVNPKTGQLLMTSIPRDYQVYLPDKENQMDKLTHTGFYGVKTTMLAEEDLLDITANYYVKVNFTTVEKFIDAVGGVDVYSEYEFTPVKLKSWTVQEGMNHMDGKQALAFARERKAFPSGDNQRVKNQQAVFEAMFKKATSSKTMILSYSNVLAELRDYVEMSFSSREVRALVKHQASKNIKWSIYKNALIGGDDLLPLYSTGGEYAYVMTQDEASVSHAKELINAVLNGDPLTKDENGVVQVLNSDGESAEGE